jgi:hypothetical protein
VGMLLYIWVSFELAVTMQETNQILIPLSNPFSCGVFSTSRSMMPYGQDTFSFFFSFLSTNVASYLV